MYTHGEYHCALKWPLSSLSSQQYESSRAANMSRFGANLEVASFRLSIPNFICNAIMAQVAFCTCLHHDGTDDFI